ncbi:type II toxin-antitoxin system Phd/YefM family antitoxin [Petrachloros mirabilis]
MGPTVINATDLRVKTREIMERVRFKGESFLVQTFGQPTAIIISVDEYDSLTKQSRYPSVHQIGEPMIERIRETAEHG